MSVSVETHAHPTPGTPEYDAEPMLLHQFDNLEQQELSSTLGMWTFLATEVMFFGGLILAFALYRSLYHAEFEDAATWLNIPLGGVNTVILLTSSLTMALAVRASKLRQRMATVRFLILTMILGCGFLGVKAIEWTADYEENLIPGIKWHWEGPKGGKHSESSEVLAAEKADSVEPQGFVDPRLEPNYGNEMSRSLESGRTQMFFVLYFFMTGLHAIHMIVGVGIVLVITLLVWRGWVSGTGSTQVEMAGLYWHFVDIVWVYLYPLLYLIDIQHK